MRPILCIAAGVFAAVVISCSGEKMKVPEPNNIRDYLINAATAISDHSLSDVHTLNDWQKIRDIRYKEFIEMMSLYDLPLNTTRTPLNTKVTGTIQQKGYHIEKLYYESLPGLFVRANLYVPDQIKKPVPGILYVCGHAPTQKVHYQAHPAKFARLGFVCLVIETIQFGEVRGEHWGCYAKGWFNWYSRGYDPAGVELWNAIRGIDLLTERPEVDPEKLGVTGISGGGSQSWYIAAADPRIKAVAPVCGASTLKAQITTRTIDGHCDCMMPINTYQQDFMDFGALIAPKPLLICQADRDGLNQVESVRDLYRQIRNIYELYHAGDRIGLVETPGGHSYHKISRERIFSFFIQHLMDKKVTPEEAGDIDESEQSQLSEDDLRVYSDGPPANDITTTIQDSFVKMPAPPDISNETELTAFRDTVRAFLKTRTFGAFPATGPSFDKALVFRTLDGGKFGEEIFSFTAEKGWRLKVDIHWAHKPDSLNPLLIIMRNSEEERWSSEAFASGIPGDRNIAFFETRGVGEFGWAPELQWHVRRASAWTGRTLASMQVYDLLRCIEFCRTLPGVDPAKVSLAARNETGVVALYAALMDGKCESVILKNPPETQDQASNPDGRGPAIEMLNCLRITDVYQIPALLEPAKTIFADEIPPAYLWSEKVLEKAGKGPFSLLHKN
jgi:cephalosporin-C deacetylase-like acetyl esterase